MPGTTHDQLMELRRAHDEVGQLLEAIPDTALDWMLDDGGWSLHRLIAHLAHSHDFYVMVVEETRANNFAPVRLHSKLDGWQRMQETDAAVAQTHTVAGALHYFEATYERMMDVLGTLTEAELDRPFLFDSSHPEAEPVETTLRTRVLETSASHLRDHLEQIAEFVERWQTKDEQVVASDGGSPGTQSTV